VLHIDTLVSKCTKDENDGLPLYAKKMVTACCLDDIFKTAEHNSHAFIRLSRRKRTQFEVPD
jgi:hypothetical protein